MKTNTIFGLVCLLVALQVQSAHSCPTLLNQWNAGPCRTTAYSGDWVLYGSGAQLIIGELGEDQALHRISETDMPGTLLDIAIEGTLAAIACDFAGLQLLDISQPEAPQKLALIQVPLSTFRVILEESRAYVLSRKINSYPDSSTLSIYDCSDPSSPDLLGQISLVTNAGDAALYGTHLYVANFYDGLTVIDISDPSNPIQVAELWEAMGARAIKVHGDTAYAALGGNGLAVFDLSSPASPLFMNYVDLPGSSDLIVGRGDYLYVGTEKNGIHILDASDPQNPTQVSTLETEYPLYHLGVGASQLLVSYYTLGLTMYNLDDPEQPDRITTESMQGSALNVIEMNNYLLVNEFPFGVRIYEISEDLDIHLINLIPIEERFVMAVREPYLFVCEASNGHVRIYDLSNPNNIVQLSELDLDGEVTEMSANATHLFFSSSEGVKVVTIADPESPTILPILPYPCTSLDVYGTLLAVSSEGVKVLNITDPEHPGILGEWGSYFPENIEIDDRYIYASTSSRLQILDYHQKGSESVTNPVRNTHYSGELSVDWPYGVVLDFNNNRMDTLIVYPLISPVIPSSPLGELPIKGAGRGCFVNGSHVWVAQGDAGLSLFNLSGCLAPPGAGFSYHPDHDLKVRQMIEFFDQSSAFPSSWHWDFGDGTTSEDTNPVHFFQEPGDYVVTLTASNVYGSSSFSQTLIMTPDDTIPPIDLPGNYVYLLPSVGVGEGSKGSQWSSKIQINSFSSGAGDSTVYLYFLEERAAESTIVTARMDFHSSSIMVFDNVLQTIFGRSSSRGALLLKSSGPLSLAAAVINDTGAEGILAQRIPVLKMQDLLGCASAGSIDFLFNEQPVRVNVGIVNLSPEPLLIFIPDLLTLYLLEIPAFSYRQVNNIYQYTNDALPRIDVEAYGESDTEGGYFGFASVIDNRNGNPIFFPIQQP